MKTKPTNALISVVLILFFMLFSSAECNKDPEEGEDCNPIKFYDSEVYTSSTDPNLIQIDPPKLTYLINGPSDICTHKHIDVYAALHYLEAPPNTITSVCTVEWSLFYEYPINLDNYDATVLMNDSDFVNFGLGVFDGHKGYITYRFEISWNPTTPYTSEAELLAFAHYYFLTIVTSCEYYEFKPLSP